MVFWNFLMEVFHSTDPGLLNVARFDNAIYRHSQLNKVLRVQVLFFIL